MSELTPAEMEDMPAGSKVYDQGGDSMTKDAEGFWSYWPEYFKGVKSPTAWGPYTSVPPVDPADPNYDPKQDARR